MTEDILWIDTESWSCFSLICTRSNEGHTLQTFLWLEMLHHSYSQNDYWLCINIHDIYLSFFIIRNAYKTYKNQFLYIVNHVCLIDSHMIFIWNWLVHFRMSAAEIKNNNVVMKNEIVSTKFLMHSLWQKIIS